MLLGKSWGRRPGHNKGVNVSWFVTVPWSRPGDTRDDYQILVGMRATYISTVYPRATLHSIQLCPLDPNLLKACALL
jgi:hypothetical protein